MLGVAICCSVLQAHKGAPLTGVLLCRSVHQALKGAPWAGSYSVVQCVRHLMGQPFYCSAADVGMCRERSYGDGSTTLCVTQQYHLASMAPWLSSTSISHHNLFPHIPSICLSAVNSSPRPGISPQSLNSSSQQLCLSGEQRSFPRVCVAASRIV